MAAKAQAIDGLVHRLLKQSGKSSAAVESHKIIAESRGNHDGISSEAEVKPSENPLEIHSELPERPGEKALESHLLSLYRLKGKKGG